MANMSKLGVGLKGRKPEALPPTPKKNTLASIEDPAGSTSEVAGGLNTSEETRVNNTSNHAFGTSFEHSFNLGGTADSGASSQSRIDTLREILQKIWELYERTKPENYIPALKKDRVMSIAKGFLRATTVDHSPRTHTPQHSGSSVAHTEGSSSNHDGNCSGISMISTPYEEELMAKQWSANKKILSLGNAAEVKELALKTRMLATIKTLMDPIDWPLEILLNRKDRYDLITRLQICRLKLVTFGFEILAEILRSGPQSYEDCIGSPFYAAINGEDDGIPHDMVPDIDFVDLEHLLENYSNPSISELPDDCFQY